jgi:hypothetical protein
MKRGEKFHDFFIGDNGPHTADRDGRIVETLVERVSAPNRARGSRSCREKIACVSVCSAEASGVLLSAREPCLRSVWPVAASPPPAVSSSSSMAEVGAKVRLRIARPRSIPVRGRFQDAPGAEMNPDAERAMQSYLDWRSEEMVPVRVKWSKPVSGPVKIASPFKVPPPVAFAKRPSPPATCQFPLMSSPPGVGVA